MLRGVDVSAAVAAPGVVAVVTAADLALAPFKPFEVVPAAFARPPLATDRVRFVGEPIALVVADSAALAVDAAELVSVEIEALPAVVGPDAALAAGAPVLFPEAGSNVVIHYDRGRVADLFDDAAHVVEGRFPNQRLASAPMEPSAIVVRLDGGRLDVWATCQGVHVARHELASALGVEEDRIRVRAAAVGGGFGGRHAVPIEFVVVAAATRHLGRALRWDETRTENLLTMVHGRAQCHEVAMGFDDDGRLTALRVRNLADCGICIHAGAEAGVLEVGGGALAARLGHRHRVVAVVATRAPAVPRGVNGERDAAVGALEGVAALAAEHGGGVAAAVEQHQYLLTPGELPHTTVTKVTYDSGDYPAALERAAELIDWPGAREQSRPPRPVRPVAARCRDGLLRVDHRWPHRVRRGRCGCGRRHGPVRCGTLSHGQSHATTIGAAVAAELGVALEAIRYVDRDTDLVPGAGHGRVASAQMAGGAALAAAPGDRPARALAAERLEAKVDDIVVMQAGDGRPGGLGVAGVPTSVLGWAELARAAGPEGLGAEIDFTLEGAAFSSGAHASLVEVDVETGAVRLLRHVAVDDCGTVLNPAVVAGQQHGGSAAGIGQALFEEISYDPSGTPRATTFADYLLPSAAELPWFETDTLDIPTPIAPNGAKGIGENGAIAAPTSVQNAVVDALSHLGVRHLDLPLTPEAVWRALVAADRCS
jgi:carbon-monoxide dehydrogenase large subunit